MLFTICDDPLRLPTIHLLPLEFILLAKSTTVHIHSNSQSRRHLVTFNRPRIHKTPIR